MIRSEIESGQFTVDTGKVADGMINDAVGLLKK
jgi:negative regulator of flagellin synthesis FlgM